LGLALVKLELGSLSFEGLGSGHKPERGFAQAIEINAVKEGGEAGQIDLFQLGQLLVLDEEGVFIGVFSFRTGLEPEGTQAVDLGRSEPGDVT